jgi:hypothetical protein
LHPEFENKKKRKRKKEKKMMKRSFVGGMKFLLNYFQHQE